MAIRKMEREDLERTAVIWLDANLSAHGFVPARYWEDLFEPVKGMLLQAEVYVCEEDEQIKGFIGLSGDEVAGIFVRSGGRSRGVGGRLMDFAKSRRDRLQLHVYQKNVRALRFYQREGFRVQCEHTDGDTGEPEYVMAWEKEDQGGR